MWLIGAVFAAVFLIKVFAAFESAGVSEDAAALLSLVVLTGVSAFILFLLNRTPSGGRSSYTRETSHGSKSPKRNTLENPNSYSDFSSAAHTASSSRKPADNIVKDYGSPEDFYCDYPDVFDCFDDAEDYYNDNGGK